MIFSEHQISEILRIIDFQHAFFIGTDISVDVLSESDKHILRQYGVEPEQLRTDFTPYEQAFYFGRLTTALKDQAGKVGYNDFLQYLRRGQYVPLSQKEQNALNYVRKQSYSHIKNLGQRIRQDVDRIIIEEDIKKRHEYERIIQGSLEEAIKKRGSVKDVVLSIGNKTKDWGRDLGRIAETEMQAAFETGRAEEIRKEYGDRAIVYKDVFPGACRYCIRLFTTNGIGSEPKLFKLEQLIANGTNIGRKVDDWKATIPPVHPFCFTNYRTPIYTSKGWRYIKDIKVGDLVLTHKKRFRKVTQLIFTEREVESTFTITCKMKREGRTIQLRDITGDHPILVNNNWIKAKSIKIGQKVSLLHDKCDYKECNQDYPIFSRDNIDRGKVDHCSVSCKSFDKSSKRTLEERQELTRNGRGEYNFHEIEIISVEEKVINKVRKLYNFSVEEDESYIANGIPVHNCRCLLSHKDQDTIWNEEKKRYVDKPYERIFERPKVRVIINDKEFFV